MRLTRKDDFNIKHYTIKELATELDCLDKLGQLEDIEEELGIDLVYFIKLVIQGYAYVKNYPFNNKIKKAFLIGFDKELLGKYIVYFKTNEEEGYSFLLINKGISWALTREELL